MSTLRTPGFPQVVADLHQGDFLQSNQSLVTLTQGMRGVWRDGEIQPARMLRFGDKCGRLSTVFARLWSEMGNRLPGRSRRGAGVPRVGQRWPGDPPDAPASKGPPLARSVASTG